MTISEVKTRKKESKLIFGAAMAAIYVACPSNCLRQEMSPVYFENSIEGFYDDELRENESATPLFSTRNLNHLRLKFPNMYFLYTLASEVFIKKWRKDGQFNIGSYGRLI